MKDTRLRTQVYNVTSLHFLTQLPSIDGEEVDYRESKFSTLIHFYESSVYGAVY